MSCLRRRCPPGTAARLPHSPPSECVVHPCNLSNQIPSILVQRQVSCEAHVFSHGNRSTSCPWPLPCVRACVRVPHCPLPHLSPSKTGVLMLSQSTVMMWLLVPCSQLPRAWAKAAFIILTGLLGVSYKCFVSYYEPTYVPHITPVRGSPA